MAETCNSRHLSRLMNSCFLNPATDVLPVTTTAAATATTISSLPDDLFLEILSHVPTAFLPPLPYVCRRWSVLLPPPPPPSPPLSLAPPHLPFHFPLLRNSIIVPRIAPHDRNSRILATSPDRPTPREARINLLTPFLISPRGSFLFNSLTLALTPPTPMLTPRKNFASASLSGKIYIAGEKPSPLLSLTINCGGVRSRVGYLACCRKLIQATLRLYRSCC